MDLKSYLNDKHDTQTGLAEKLGVSQGLVHQWVVGITKITAERAKQIELATRGLVKRHELRPDIFEKAA